MLNLVKFKKADYAIIHRTFLRILLVQIVTFVVGVTGMIVDGGVISGSLGPDAIAAYQYIAPIVTIYSAVGGFLSVGVSTMCGRGAGVADINKVNRILSTGLLLGIGFGVLLTIITIGCAPYLAYALGARDNVLKLATTYLRGFGASAPALLLTVLLMPVLQIDGDRQLVFVAVITMTLTNVVISLLSGKVLFPGDLNKKILGVALATTFSYVIALAILLCHFLKKKRMIKMSFKLFDSSLIKYFVTYGLPYGIQQLSAAVLIICMDLILSPFAGAVGAFGIINTASNICLAVGSGIGQTIAILSGVFLGEEDRDSLKKLLKIGLTYSIILNIVVGVAIILGAGPLINLLKGSGAYTPEQIDLTVFGLRCFAGSIIFYSMNVCFKCYYQAAHRVFVASSFAFIQNFLAIFLPALILGKTIGVESIFFSYIIGQCLSFIYLLLFTMIKKRRFKINLDDMLLLPDSFAKDNEIAFYGRASSLEEANELSQQVSTFCENNNLDRIMSFWFSLIVEEYSNNVIRFNTNAKQISKATVEVKIIKQKTQWIIRFRDNGKLFNPIAYLKGNDKIEHFGIRLLLAKANRQEYLSTLHLNNLLLVYKTN